MDAITLRASALECANALQNSRIEKIYQPKPDTLFLKAQGGTLLISCHPSRFTLHLTAQKPQNPAQPPMFCMLLRKHLTGARVKAITMDSLERIVTLDLENVNELYEKVRFHLICELMGRNSNIMFTDESGKILDSLKRVPLSVSTVRQILPGLPYTAPPAAKNLLPLTPPYPEDLSSAAGLSSYCKGKIAEGKLTLVQLMDSMQSPSPHLRTVPGKGCQPLTVLIPGEPLTPYPTMGQMLDAYFLRLPDNLNHTDLIRSLRTILTRLENKISIHEKTLNQDGEKDRLYGELLTSYTHQIPQNAPSVTLLNYYTNEEVTIPLDPQKSPNENAQRYFKRHRKIKTAKQMATEQLAIAREQVEYLENAIAFLEQAKTENDVLLIKQELMEQGFLRKRKAKQKARASKPITYQTSGGCPVLVGRNSAQNDQLTLKTARPDDIWLHTKEIPGSHVILSAPLTDEHALEDAAQIAAYHSKGQDSQNVPVDYTLVRYVKKPAHALPGKVIYTHQKTLYVTPDKEKLQQWRKD